jgi:hypothetical protein
MLFPSRSCAPLIVGDGLLLAPTCGPPATARNSVRAGRPWAVGLASWR